VDTGPHVLPVPGVLDGWCREGLRVVFGCFQDEEKSRRRRSRSCSRRGSVATTNRGLDGRFVSTGPSPSRRRQDEDDRLRSRRRRGRPSCGLAVAVAAQGDAADGAQDGDHR